MRILLAGNSQLSCLKLAFDQQSTILNQLADVSFYVFPGGTGPAFTIENDRLVVIESAVNPAFPPMAYPTEALDAPISRYDIIVVSALGFIDGGFYYDMPYIRQGLLYEYVPKANDITNRFISKPCYKRIVSNVLHYQSGFKFLKCLRNHFSGRIIVQPFPLLSETVKDHLGWPLNQMYSNPLGAHQFFCKTRDEVLADVCRLLSAELLPYPREEFLANLFTPADLMWTSDGTHSTMEYGEMVIMQIADTIKRPM